ncbi:hypothetical protein ACFW88_00220 [Streptomyces anandii]|uniref:Uncharacterized protein n=1 Tax=Streptomyces anandii TaxID=285454 RepID=A0ABW6GXQ2_9ACTN
MTAPTNTATAGGESSGRPARPERPPGYWERIDRIVAAAPPLSDEQKAIIFTAFHQPAAREVA